jgi:hypothetical protein
VFTVRYALSPYIKRTRFVFEALTAIREPSSLCGAEKSGRTERGEQYFEIPLSLKVRIFYFISICILYSNVMLLYLSRLSVHNCLIRNADVNVWFFGFLNSVTAVRLLKILTEQLGVAVTPCSCIR